MAKTIAELLLRRWVEENLPGAKIIIEGRCAKITDGNGDTLNIAYDPKNRQIICLDGYTDF